MTLKSNILISIPVELPMKRILFRLGYKHQQTQLSERQQNTFNKAIDHAFSLCLPKGIWARVPIKIKDDVISLVNTNKEIKSKSLAQLLAKSHDILLFAATVGPDIMEMIVQLSKSDGASAVIYDAVGGQTADAAIDWMQTYINRQLSRHCKCLTKQRFSPGFGDLGLENQHIIYNLLNLEKIGLQLTPSYMLLPEKSVIAIAGIQMAHIL